MKLYPYEKCVWGGGGIKKVLAMLEGGGAQKVVGHETSWGGGGNKFWTHNFPIL